MGVERHLVSMVGGVNLLNDTRTIRDDEVAKAKNVFPIVKGMASKRKGVAYAGWGPNYDEIPLGMMIPPFPDLDYVALTVSRSAPLTAYAYVGDFDLAATDRKAIDPIIGYRQFMVAAGNEVFILLGKEQAGHASTLLRGYMDRSVVPPVLSLNYSNLKKSDGVTVWPSLAPRVACMYRNRMVWANFGTGYENTLLWSDLVSPVNGDKNILVVGDDALATRSVNIQGFAGDRIVAMAEVFLTDIGAPPQTALLVLGERNACLVTGEPEQSTYAGSNYFADVQANLVSYPCGCASAETLVRTPYGIIWAGHDDVWMFATGQVPVRIGTKIRPALAQTAGDKRYLWHAAYHNGVYRLAVMSEGQGPAHWAACGEQWWLDLRDGPPQGHLDARWWGPQVFKVGSESATAPEAGTYCMASDVRAGKDSELWGVHPGVHGFYNGTTARPRSAVLVRYDRLSGYDSAMNTEGLSLPAFEVVGGVPTLVQAVPLAREIDNEITIEVLTKSYAFEDPQVDKLFLGAELSVWNSELAQLNVEVIADGGRQVYTKNIEVDQTGYVVGVDPLGTRVTREFQSLLLDEDENTRDPGKFLQFKFTDTAGWPIPVGGLNSALFWAPQGGDLYTVSLTAGFYANAAAFLTHLVDKMDDILGAPEMTYTRDLVVSLFGWANGSGFTVPASLGIISFSLPGYATQMRRNKKLMGSLGYNTNLAELDGGAGSLVAANGVRNKLSGDLDIAGIVLNIYRFGRRPEHASS